MSEFLRIFNDKKRIMFLSGLLVLNIIFILKDNYSLMDRSKAYDEAVSDYQTMSIDEAYEENRKNVDGFYERLGMRLMTVRSRDKL